MFPFSIYVSKHRTPGEIYWSSHGITRISHSQKQQSPPVWEYTLRMWTREHRGGGALGKQLKMRPNETEAALATRKPHHSEWGHFSPFERSFPVGQNKRNWDQVSLFETRRFQTIQNDISLARRGWAFWRPLKMRPFETNSEITLVCPFKMSPFQSEWVPKWPMESFFGPAVTTSITERKALPLPMWN